MTLVQEVPAAMIGQLVVYLGAAIGTILLSYFVLGAISYLVYEPKRADEPADDVTFVIPTVASESVRDSLLNCLDYHSELFSEYDIYCVVDEGADLQDELQTLDGFDTVVVPDSYECNAIAKGRAIQYFIDTVVADDPSGWYSFIDDDNLVRDRRFLYEIPYYEARGYGAMNSVLVPRKGKSTLTFIMDHIRLLDDLTVFRAFTGMFKRPYIGFHGELLTARGDVLLDVGFDRHSIVEDYAFAAELIKEGVPTWQSATRVSILSPHSLVDLLKQRSRWFIGTWNLLRRTSPVTKFVTGVRLVSWSAAILAGPIAFLVGHMSGTIPMPLVLKAAPMIAGIVYGGTYAYGVFQLSGWQRLTMLVLVPFCVVCEASGPLYAALFADRDFTVIEK